MGETNEQLKLPDWINEDFFKDVLVKDVPDHVKVKNMTVHYALPPGENFASLMFRVHFDLEMKNGSVLKKSYVLKTMLDDDKGGHEIKEMSLFPKEIQMYKTYLPAFEDLYKAAGWNIQLAPKCLLDEIKKDRMNLVFEDLKEKLFTNVNRMEGMDMAHMKRTLCKLAEFHAVSAVYEEQHGPYPSEYHKGFGGTENQDEFQRKMFSNKEKTFKKAFYSWGLDDPEKCLKKFPTYEQYKACALRTSNTKDNIFNVLTHGDFWSSNVMQNYLPNGEINEMLLVDFQFCKWGSPAEDLLFFISISAAKDIRIKEYEHFVEIYYERLIECLKVLNYKKRLPKLREMQMEMYKEQTTFYAFFAIFNHLPLLLLPSSKDSNLEMLITDSKEADEVRMRMFTASAFAEIMKEFYPFYLRRGLFNFEDYD